MRSALFSLVRFIFVLLAITVSFISARGDKCKELKGHVGPVCSVVFSPDGKLLASGGNEDKDERIIIWDVASGKQVSSLKEKGGGSMLSAFLTITTRS